MKPPRPHSLPRPFQREKGSLKRNLFAVALGVCLPVCEALTQSPTPFPDFEPKIRFDHLTVDHGLSNGVVNAILQDRKGFMWFGTQQGLNKYDGYQFRIFQHDPADTTTLPNDHITALFEDRQGRLWIGTAGSFLVLFDPLTERFLKYRLETAPAAKSAEHERVTSAAVQTIAEDSSGALWLITQARQLFHCRFEHETGIARLKLVAMPDRCEVYSLCIEAPAIAWVANSCGLRQLALENDETHTQRAKTAAKQSTARDLASVKTSEMKPYSPSPLHGNRITDVHRDSAGVFWLMTERGLIRFDHRQGSFTSFSFPDTALRFGGEHRLTLDRRDNVWVATAQGLLFFSAKNHTYQWIGNDSRNPNSLSNNNINAIYQDAGGVIWIGTNGNGVDKYAPNANKFHAGVSRSGEEVWTARGMSIRALSETGAGMERTLWVGSYSGLFRYDRATNRPVNLDENPVFNRLKTPAAPLYVQALLADRTGSLWIGTGSKGLGRLDLKRGSLRLYPAIAGDPAGLPHPSVSAIYESREGTIWVLTPGALSRFNREAETFTSFYFDRARSQAGDRAALPGCIVQDSDGYLWLGSESSGLMQFDPARGSFLSYKHDASDVQSLSQDLVRAILPDPVEPDRFLWAGTNEGLNRFDRRSKKFMHFTEKDGLSHRVVYGILADRAGNLWISTNNGISRFNPKTQSFRSFNVTDGLQSREFNTGAYYQSKAGEMFFGGINGFNAFYPEDIHDNNIPPAVVITDLRLFNQSVSFHAKNSPLARPITHTSELNLSYRDKVITFEFGALDYNTPAKNSYAYKMENFDRDWIMNGANRTAHYTNLDPGAYVFRVKAANADGVWHENGTTLKINIPPPPWQTWWAYVFYALFIVIVFLGARRYELNRLQLKNQVRLEHLEAEKLKEIDHLKSRFFANISHEFRTPLTLLLGPLEHVSTKIPDPGLRQQLQTAFNNGRRLLRLINQLLDLSKLEAGGMTLRASRGNLIAFLKGIVSTFEPGAGQQGLTLEFQTAYDRLEVYYDVEKLEQVFYNLMSNAIKFIPANSGGAISIKVQKAQVTFLEKLPPNVECVHITVRDTGIGIPAELLPRIFDRFYRVESPRVRAQEGTGIGLALAKEMVELHYGQISVSSEEGKGTSFVVILPLGKGHLKPQEIVEDAAGVPGLAVRGSKIDDRELMTAGLTLGPSLDPSIQEPASSLEHPASSIHNPVSSHEIILLVEDNEDVRAFVRQQLGERYEVLEAVDGQEGLIKAAETVPDLVISDVMMPEMDGYALCHALKTEEKTSHIPVILLTAKGGQESKLEGLEIGADDYLTKPFSSKELLARVRNLIEQRRLLRERFGRELILKPNDVAITPQDEQFLNRVKAAIEKNLGDEDFSVEHLSHEVGMSRTQLHRKLKALTDQSAGQFILSMRLQRAHELLKQNAGTVAEIAYMTGFNTPNYFAKCFRHQFGSSPSEYKMNLSREHA